MGALNLVFRGYNVELLDAFTTFCNKTALSLGIDKVKGPISFPRHIQKWSTLSSPFIHKKAWTQLERRTFKRGLILIDPSLHSRQRQNIAAGGNDGLLEHYIWYIQKHSPPDIHIFYNLKEDIPLQL